MELGRGLGPGAPAVAAGVLDTAAAVDSPVAMIELRNLGLGTSVIIVLLMWGECLRFAFSRALERLGISEALVGQLQIQFWLLRELCWWWSVSVMLAVLADFLLGSPTVRSMSGLVDRLVARSR